MATSELDQDRIVGINEPEQPEEEEEQGATMSLVEHLEELRRRIITSAVAIVLFSIVAFVFREQILHLLTLPLPTSALGVKDAKVNYPLAVDTVGGSFTVFLKLSLAVGIALSAPVILYQLWAFVAPGLTRRERKWSGPFVFIGVILFFIGIVVGFLTLRFPVQWLIGFGQGDFLELVTADNYFTFIAFFMLAFGIVFELPLVLTFLAQIGIVSSQMLRRKRAVALISLWILSTVLTPGTDPYSPVILGAAMTVLYELSIIMIRVTKK